MVEIIAKQHLSLTITANGIFFPNPPVMPVGTPVPVNKRKKPSKIITDLSHVTQDGKADMK